MNNTTQIYKLVTTCVYINSRKGYKFVYSIEYTRLNARKDISAKLAIQVQEKVAVQVMLMEMASLKVVQ